jgi:hypothetical protein
MDAQKGSDPQAGEFQDEWGTDEAPAEPVGEEDAIDKGSAGDAAAALTALASAAAEVEPASPPPSAPPPVCRKCGYNLTGLDGSTRCPECGTPVGISLKGNYLRFSHPRFMQMLARGAMLVVVGICQLILTYFCFVVLSITETVREDILEWVMTASLLLLNALFVGGFWMLTARDPSGIGEDTYGRSRMIVRVTLLITLLISLAYQFFIMATESRLISRPLAESPLLLIVMPLIGYFSSGIGLLAQLQYLGKLARRIPSISIVSWADGLKYLFGLALIVLTLLIAWNLVVALGGRYISGGGVGIAYLVVAVTLLVLSLGYLLLLNKLRRSLRDQVALSRVVWADAA